MFKQFLRGIKSLAQWFPVIWKDRQWDYDFFFVILEKKLQLMKEFYLGDESVTADREETARNIDIALKLIDNILNDNYLLDALIPFEEKYPDYDWFIKTEPTKDGNNRLIDNDTDEQRKFKFQCYQKSEENLNADLDKLFQHIRNNIRSWWD